MIQSLHNDACLEPCDSSVLIMEPLILTEHEQRLFGELFQHCDVENMGKVTGLKATELFLASGLPQDMLHQITELCGAKRLGFFGRSQFYVALKLIAAAQVGYPVGVDTFNSGREIPLPKFGLQIDTERRQSFPAYNQHVTTNQDQIMHDRTNQIALQPSSQLAPPPKLTRQAQATRAPQGFDASNPQQQVQSEDTISPTFSPSQSPPMSPTVRQSQPVQPTTPQHPQRLENLGKQHSAPSVVHANQAVGLSLTHADGTNKIDKAWASFDDDHQGLITEESKDWAHFTDSTSGKADTSSISSEAESVEDVWSITDEQREYYVNQFKTMQSDVRGVISGAVAKEFFEKSKLPIHELSKIWQLSDVNKDGALSLDEFCNAMHLVVLRRNDIELPDSLPPSLMLYIPLGCSDEPFAADLPPGSTLKRASPVSPSQWTTTFPPPESPTSSSVSSPGNKPTPVNFEFRPITADNDSKIVHPVAVRMSPNGQVIPIDERTRTYPDSSQYEVLSDPPPGVEVVLSPSSKQTPPSAFTDQLIDFSGESQLQHGHNMPLQSRPRPTPKKAQSVPGPSQESHGQPILLPPPSSQEQHPPDRPSNLQVTAGGAPESAPIPPPRAKSSHSRSSSLDNQLIDLSDTGQGSLEYAPAVPPRPSPKDMTGGSSSGDQEVGVSPLHSDKDSLSSEGNDEDDLVDNRFSNRSFRPDSPEPVGLHLKIRKQRVKNIRLSRLNGELNQELQEVMEQRIALEIQLEHLRPFSS